MLKLKDKVFMEKHLNLVFMAEDIGEIPKPEPVFLGDESEELT